MTTRAETNYYSKMKVTLAIEALMASIISFPYLSRNFSYSNRITSIDTLGISDSINHISSNKRWIDKAVIIFVKTFCILDLEQISLGISFKIRLFESLLIPFPVDWLIHATDNGWIADDSKLNHWSDISKIRPKSLRDG